MKHRIVAVDLFSPGEALERISDDAVQCAWCMASGRWKQASDELLTAFLNEEDELEITLQAWAQPIIRLAEQSDMSGEHISLLNDLIVQIEWIIEDPVHDSEPYIRDQLYGFVQLISSLALESLAEQEMDRACHWADIRDVFEATDAYGSGILKNAEQTFESLERLVDEDGLLFLAWNLAKTSENNSVSLSSGSLARIKDRFELASTGAIK